MSRSMVNTPVSLLLMLSMAAPVAAADQKLELAVPFTDNMILQRQTVVPVWGFDAPSAKLPAIKIEESGVGAVTGASCYG